MINNALAGNYAPVEHEQTITDLAVTGTVPDFLDGRYLRNGPNPISEVDPASYHWFSGDGMVHGIRLRDGRAEWYRNRWVRGPVAQKSLGEAVTRRRHRAGMDMNGPNTNVIGHGGKTLAIVEAGIACFELTDELDTVGQCDFDGTLPGGYTAHPKRDPETGELHAVSYFFGRGNKVQYSVIGVDGRARRTVDVEVTGSPMMHDFSLTENYVIFYDLPVTFNARAAAELTVPRPLQAPAALVLSALIGRVRIPDPVMAIAERRLRGSDGVPYHWNPRYPARIGVMPREGGAADVRWFEIKPCYVFHPMNAYDIGGEIILDVVRHQSMFEINAPLSQAQATDNTSTLDRWTIDLNAGKVREERLDDRHQEFPRVDERLVGRAYRYGYAPALSLGSGGHDDTLLKHDMLKGTTQTRSFGAGNEVGEFVFQPTSPDAAEDDGVLMGFVYDKTEDRSNLMILDASTLETVGAIHLPTRVPAGFHGNWVPSD